MTAQQGLQTGLAPAQEAGRQFGVEQVADGDSKIPEQGADIVVGAVEDFADFRVRKDRTQGRAVRYFQGVHQIMAPAVGELQQAYFFLVMVEGVSLQIDGQGFYPAQGTGQGFQFRGGFNQAVCSKGRIHVEKMSYSSDRAPALPERVKPT